MTIETRKRWREGGGVQRWTEKGGRKRYRQRWKERVLDALGHQCNRCGFSDERALQVDHINGGGARHKRTLGGDQIALYRYVMSHPYEFQILCANCQWIKRVDKQEYYVAPLAVHIRR